MGVNLNVERFPIECNGNIQFNLSCPIANRTVEGQEVGSLRRGGYFEVLARPRQMRRAIAVTAVWHQRDQNVVTLRLSYSSRNVHNKLLALRQFDGRETYYMAPTDWTNVSELWTDWENTPQWLSVFTLNGGSFCVKNSTRYSVCYQARCSEYDS